MRLPYPCGTGYWQELDQSINTFKQDLDSPYSLPALCIPVLGDSLIGISGVGKTTGVSRILNLYPQVINHHLYNGRLLELLQLVWLKLECPHDGSIKQLCIEFFRMVDNILGTNYYRHYTQNGRASVDNMLGNVARVGSIHRLGILVIDEIQHLHTGKSGGKTKMLNFFVQLTNVIGVPIQLIGTFKTKFILDSEFRQTRRFTGQGDPIWDRMKYKDEQWETFVEALWVYQYVRKPVPLTKELKDTLYVETQGITDYVIKIFVAAQKRAIDTEGETLTKDIISSVAADNLRLSLPALKALRENDTTALAAFTDLMPVESAPLVINARMQDLDRKMPKNGTPPKSGPSKAKEEKQTANQDLVILPNDLRNVLKSDDKDAHQALTDKNFIEPGIEFLN